MLLDVETGCQLELPVVGTRLPFKHFDKGIIRFSTRGMGTQLAYDSSVDKGIVSHPWIPVGKYSYFNSFTDTIVDLSKFTFPEMMRYRQDSSKMILSINMEGTIFGIGNNLDQMSYFWVENGEKAENCLIVDGWHVQKISENVGRLICHDVTFNFTSRDFLWKNPIKIVKFPDIDDRKTVLIKICGGKGLDSCLLHFEIMENPDEKLEDPYLEEMRQSRRKCRFFDKVWL